MSIIYSGRIVLTGKSTSFTPQVAPESDPDWANVSLLLNTTSTNNQTNDTFLDSSSSNLTVTRVGTTTQGSFTPFTVPALTSYSATTYGGSGSFNGSSNYLTTPSSAGYQFGTGDFTVEAWVYMTAAQNGAIIDTRGSTLGIPWAFYIDASRFPYFYDGINVQTSNVAVTLNTWTHVVAVRSSGTLSIYVGGQRGYNASMGTTMNPNATVYIGGQNFLAPAYFSGNIANLRVVKGTAVYSGTSFTPPTAPVTAISGTSLLLNFANAGMYDAATKNNLLGVGNTKVSTTQSKFAPTSVEFDGTGDWLETRTTADLSYGTGNFTIEMWVRPDTINEIDGLFATSGGAGSNPKFVVFFESGVPKVHINNLGSGSKFYAASSAVTVSVWTHIAFVRSGSTWYWFINGVQSATGSDSTNITFTTQPTFVGYGGEVYFTPFDGFIQDLRVTKGVARYTAGFTPPALPFPTI